jgi:hypothetical protein
VCTTQHGTFRSSVMWDAGGFKLDVEREEAVEQSRLAIEMPFLKAALGDVILSVLEKPEPPLRAQYCRLHRIARRVPWCV